MKARIWIVLGVIVWLGSVAAPAATNSIALAVQQGLFEEEANNNLDAAIQAYKSVVGQFERNRKLAATAIFRLGECYRKQGKTNEAVASYRRIQNEFADFGSLATLSSQHLAALGATPPSWSATADLAASDAVKIKQSNEGRQIAELQKLLQNSPDLVNAFGSTPGYGGYSSGHTRLHTAALRGEYELARFLLENGALVNIAARAPDDARTPLHMAAENGHEAVVKLLINHKANVDAKELKRSKTPLHFAAGNGFLRVSEALLNAGADPKTPDNSGLTPLHAAASGGHSSLAEMLLKRGAPVNAASKSGDTPLHFAADQGHAVMATKLLEAGADVNAMSEKGRTPLSAAVQRKHMEVVRLLLSRKADPNVRTEYAGQTYPGRAVPASMSAPLHLAVEEGDFDTAKLLLESGADPNLPRVEGTSTTYALNLAVWGGQQNIVSLLLQHGADPNKLASKDYVDVGQTALIAAIKKPLERTVAELLKNKADVNLADAGGTTPLHYSVGQSGILQTILAAKPDVNATNELEETPLHWAISSGLPIVAAELIKRGADVNAADKNVTTPLHVAMIKKEKSLVALLLEAKANPNVRDKDGITPIQLDHSAYAQNTFQPAPGVTVFRKLQNPGMMQPVRALRLPGLPQSQRDEPQNDSELAQLLRKHGAATMLPDFKSIKLGRAGKVDPAVVFSKGANNWNTFTLLEALGVAYNIIDDAPKRTSSVREPPAFPDLSLIEIRRFSGNPGKWTPLVVDVQQILASGDCSQDVTLEWGDLIDVPEADHVLGEQWTSLSIEVMDALNNWLRRKVQVVVKGKSTELTLEANYNSKRAVFVEVKEARFWILPVLRESKLLLASSDLSRIKVTRTESGKNRQYYVDCSNDAAPPDFWLRDGDLIEVPEK